LTRPNRLAREKSPYLLQHAANPVDWYPWGAEAFDRALGEDKPIFLSIGYSTCHWCHVMERESFEREDVARALNEHFVAIKVDREERPDVDHVYMTVCQALTGSGGWPLTVILTPDRRPFFAGTYFPPETRFGRPGLLDVLYQVVGAWEQQRDRVARSAEEITEALQDQFAGSPGDALGEPSLRLCFDQLAARYDAEEGGFGSAPKFPTAHVFTFLLRWWRRSGDARALEMVERTLQAMRRGGIYDQIGFGFHRYSTDREWLVPHFEKMLYDQALLLLAYVETYQATGNPFYAGVAREIAAYVLRDMTGPEGAFYSAEDADSEGEEGRFYVWRASEVEEILGPEAAALFARAYGITAEGNWRDEATGSAPGTNIPHLVESPTEEGAASEAAAEDLARRLDTARLRLFEARGRRVRPLRDDKVLTAWNALVIAALSRAGAVLGEPSLTAAAERALSFVESKLVRDDGRLLARYRDGESAHPAYLDDYAFLCWGLLELYEATFAAKHLDAARKLCGEMIRLFWDDARGGFYFTGVDAEALLARAKEVYDGAMPSGNSVAAMALLRVARMTGDTSLEERAQALVRAFSGIAARFPSAHTQLMCAVDFALGPSGEIVLAGESGARDVRAMLGEVRRRYLPRHVVLLNAPGEARILHAIAPALRAQGPVDGRAAAYVCENFACKSPVTDPAALASLLDAPSRAGAS
jgi:uncharacterized protein YyaL (SSP411 family)